MSKALSKYILSIVGLFAAVLIFQNCSDVSFAPADPGFESTCVLVDGDCFSGGTAEVVAGTQNLPPLKMFFVVDNSYTMYANQVNLSQSFTKMFESSNSANLTPFDTTAFLINTSQYTYKVNESKLNNLTNDMIPFSFFEYLDYRDVLSEHRGAASISGSIPGDVYGYEILHDPTIRRHDFRPAVVTGLGDNGADGTSIELGIQKPRGESASSLNQKFQERLALLNPGISPFDYPEVLDRESGLCSVARILNQPENFVHPGDFGIFTIVSDEDDTDPNGNRCLTHIQEFTNEEELIAGTCEEYKVKFRTNRNVPCYGRYATGYKYDYSFVDPNFEVTEVTYRALESETYTSPRTKIEFTKIVNQEYARTRVQYERDSCVYRDGVKTDDCTTASYTKYGFGDHTGSCLALARTFHSNAQNAICDLGHYAEIPDGCPTLDDPLCRYDESAEERTVLGDYTSGSRCADKAESYGAWGEAPINCTPLDSTEGDGPCPSSAYGCTSEKTYASRTESVDGNQVSDCSDVAADLDDSAISDDHPPSCVLKLVNKTYNKNDKTINFTSDMDPDELASSDSTCSADVMSAILEANPDWLAGGTCTIKSIRFSGEEFSHTDTSVCTAAVNDLCTSSDGTKRSCESFTNYKFNKNVYAEENLTCNDNCSDTLSNFCEGNQTIREYFEAEFGADKCSTSTQTYKKTNFADELLSEKDNICTASVSGRISYLTQIGAPYYKDGVNQPKVSGGNNLKNYIKSEVSNLLGDSQAMSVFVRTAGDPTGSGGSRGYAYESLANEMGGTVNSVLSEDYSPALVQLTEVITEKLSRTFTIVQMRDYHRVVKVLHQSSGSSAWVELSPNDWSSSWRTVTINSDYAFELGDRFRFTFE